MKKENKEYFFEYNMGFMLTVSTVVTILAIVLGFWLLNLIHGGGKEKLEFLFNNKEFYKVLIWEFSAIVAIFLWSVLHEIIHGVFYQIGGAKRENITYGAALEKGIFYCRCGEYVNKKTIMMSLMSPFTIIGVITLIIGLIFNWSWLVLLSTVNIGGAGGDLCMFFFFLGREKDVQFMEYGDSSIFSLKTKENLDDKKFLCVKQVDKEKAPANDNAKRLVVSKGSWIFIIIIVAIFVVDLLLGLIVK